MLAAVAAFVPSLLALALIALAHDGDFVPRRMAQVAAAALAIGPLAVALLGFWGWLLLVGLGVSALTAYAALRRATPGIRVAARE